MLILIMGVVGLYCFPEVTLVILSIIAAWFAYICVSETPNKIPRTYEEKVALSQQFLKRKI